MFVLIVRKPIGSPLPFPSSLTLGAMMRLSAALSAGSP